MSSISNSTSSAVALGAAAAALAVAGLAGYVVGRRSSLMVSVVAPAPAPAPALAAVPRARAPLGNGDRAADLEAESVLIEQQFKRNVAFLGADAFSAIRDAFVIVVGVGGVGSHCAHMLVRSGVRRIRLVDFDQVTLSSLNRHAVATRADVGKPKTVAMAEHFRAIVPDVEVDARVQLFSADVAAELLAGAPAFVVDCIDHRESKIALIAYCSAHGIPLVSSMSAGARCDPSRIRVGELGDVQADALARRLRVELRKRAIAWPAVVFSSERTTIEASLAPEAADAEDASDFAALESFRATTIPVIGMVPAMFGNALAAFVINALAAAHGSATKSVESAGTSGAVAAAAGAAAAGATGTSGGRVDYDSVGTDFADKLFLDLHSRLAIRTSRVFGGSQHLPVDRHALRFLVVEAFKGRSAGASRDIRPLCVTRWDPARESLLGNLVVLTSKEATLHDAAAKRSLVERDALYGAEQVAWIVSRLELASAYADERAADTAALGSVDAAAAPGCDDAAAALDSAHVSPALGSDEAALALGSAHASPALGSDEAALALGSAHASPALGSHEAAAALGSDDAAAALGSDDTTVPNTSGDEVSSGMWF